MERERKDTEIYGRGDVYIYTRAYIYYIYAAGADGEKKIFCSKKTSDLSRGGDFG